MWPPHVGEPCGRATEGSLASLSRVDLEEIMSSLGIPEEDMYPPRFLDVPVV